MNQAQKKQYLIRQLNSLGIYETLKSEPLASVCYCTLRCMLAMERAVRS